MPRVPTQATPGPKVDKIAHQVLTTGCGFAITSGLCLLAAAITESGAKRREPPNRLTDGGPTSGPG